MRWIDTAAIRVGLPELCDGLADVAYVCEGTFLEFGVDSGPIHAEVHRSNMAKVGGKADARGKIQKPAGWMPPDIGGCLRAQGWEP
jgi:predicted HAD superfamily Cof-like phosphohydrolase